MYVQPNRIKMKSYSYFLLVIISVQLAFANSIAAKQADSLLNVLDKTLVQYPVLNNVKEAYIKKIKQKLAKTSNPSIRFNIYGELFDAYKNYQMDSALIISLKRNDEATKLGNKKDLQLAKLNYAQVMLMSGMYKNALDTIKVQQINAADKEIKEYVFHLYHSFYLLMNEFALTKEDKNHYSNLVMEYKDSILNILPKDNLGYYLVKSSQLEENGNYTDALSWAEKAYQKYTFRHSKALSAYAIAAVYEKMGDTENEKKFLAISAIDDIENGVKEYISLRKLATLLYKEGDIDRAYRYTKRSMEDAIFSNARFRTYEISQMLPIINTAYDIKNAHEKRNLRIGILIITLLTLVVIGFFIYTYKQLMALAKARRSLKEINKELQSINMDLTTANSQLSESNLVKEVYIGYVFRMCSDYIDKMDNLRKRVNRKIKAGQISDLQKFTDSTTFVDDELKEFYHNFDSVFLKLYPQFVEEFNSLLLPEKQIVPKSTDSHTRIENFCACQTWSK